MNARIGKRLQLRIFPLVARTGLISNRLVDSIRFFQVFRKIYSVRDLKSPIPGYRDT